MATAKITDGNLKKYFYSGIGFAAHSKELMQHSADELMKQGKISESEGKRIINDTAKKLEGKYNEAVHKLSLWTKSEVSKLNAEILKLEKQLAVKSKSNSRSVSSVSETKKVVKKAVKRPIKKGAKAKR